MSKRLTARGLYKSLIYTGDMTSAQVARSIAMGVGSAFLPFPGFQTAVFVPYCLIFRLNLVIAYLSSWLNNPFTLGPITALEFWTGAEIMERIQPGWSGLPLSLEELARMDGLCVMENLAAFGLGSLVYVILFSLLCYFPAYFIVSSYRARRSVMDDLRENGEQYKPGLIDLSP
jgi:uncharacterized protein (DUF2062 family)